MSILGRLLGIGLGSSGAGWSPRAQVEAWKSNYKEIEERNHRLAVAGAKGKRYLNAEQDSIAKKMFKDLIEDPYGTSREAYQRGFRQAWVTKNDFLMQGLIESAQTNSMFDDVLDAVVGDRKIWDFFEAIGFTRDDFNRKDNGMRSAFLKTLYGTDQEGLRRVYKAQEAATGAGNYTAMDVFWMPGPGPEGGKYLARDRNNPEDMEVMLTVWIKRFQSPDADVMRKLRKETFYGDDLLFELMNRGMLTPLHYEPRNMQKMRASTLIHLKENLPIIWRSGEDGKRFVEALYEQRKIIKSDNPTGIIMISHINKNVYWGEIDIADLESLVLTDPFLDLTEERQQAFQDEWEILIYLKAKHSLKDTDYNALLDKVLASTVINQKTKHAIASVTRRAKT